MKPPHLFHPQSLLRSTTRISTTHLKVCTRALSLPTSTPPSKSFAHLPTRRLISLTGPETLHFLQGLITQNTSPNPPRTASGFYTAFLTAQGRVLNDVFIYNVRSGQEGKEEWLIEVDANEAESLYKHVKRYKLRKKVQARLLGVDEMGVWSFWEEGGMWKAHGIPSSGAEQSSTSSSSIGGANAVASLEDIRAPGMGHRLILPAATKPTHLECDESPELEYRIRRYLKGVPEGQGEILREAALPQESCIDYMGGIDYRKGCYVGQELTIRTHHTGVVRKRILPVMLYAEGEEIPEALEWKSEGGIGEGLEGGAPIAIEKIGGKGRGKAGGRLLAGVGRLGLALCRLEMMTGVAVGGEGVEGGFKSGDEFVLKDEGEGEKPLRVKAFVPSWHLNR